MPKKWVVNASPVISLTRINKASFLIELCDELLIPILNQLDQIGFRISRNLFDAVADLASEKGN